MSKLKLYYDLMSQPSRTVWIFLKVNNIPFEDIPVALRKGEHFKEPFTKINPFQKVPVIDDDGFILTESVAIMQYVSTKYPSASSWYPTDLKYRARVNEYVSWHHLNIRIGASMYFQTKVIKPNMLNAPVDTIKLNNFKEQLDKSLDLMENVFLGRGQPYLCGPTITIADLLASCEVLQSTAAGFDVTVGRPRLTKWLQSVQQQTDPYFNEAHKMVWKLKEVYSSQAKM